MAANCGLLDLPGPVPENIVSFLGPAARKVFRLTCKDAQHLVDRTVRSVTIDVSNVRALCGPWQPLHTTFPQLRHLIVCLRSTGAVTWDVPQSPLAAAAASGGGSRSNGRASGGPAAAAASFSLRLLRDSVPRLRHLRSLDLTQCYVDPQVWAALCGGSGGAAAAGSGGGGGLPHGLALRLHPAAALLFPGRTWGERLGTMLRQLAAAQPEVRVSVAACGGGGIGGGIGGGGIGAGGAACWCDVQGEAGLKKLADMPYIHELPVCVWSRAPCQPGWLGPMSALTRLTRLHISCCNASDPWGHGWLGGLTALAGLRELNLGLTDSPLCLSELAPLAACTALTALSVGALTAAAPLAAGPAAAGLPPVVPPGGGGGGAAAAAASVAGTVITPLPYLRRLEVRCCLAAGSLPLSELVPCAVSVSMCALSIGGGSGGGGHGGRMISGNVLESLLTPAASAAAAAAAAAPPPLPPARVLSLRQLHAHRRLQRQALAAAAPPPPPPADMLAAAAQLRCGLRSLELVQHETAAITLGPAMDDTGCLPLPYTALLGELYGLEHLQFTGWRLPGGQLPALLSAAQRLPRLRRLTLHGCDAQRFGWRASRAAQLGLGLGLGLWLRPLGALAGPQLGALEHLEVIGAPSLRLLEQVTLACRTPELRRLEVHGVYSWDERAFQRILGTASRAAAAAAAASAAAAVTAAVGARAPEVVEQSGGAAAAAAAAEGGGGASGLPRVFVALAAAAAHAAAAAGSGACKRVNAVDAVPPVELPRRPSATWPVPGRGPTKLTKLSATAETAMTAAAHTLSPVLPPPPPGRGSARLHSFPDASRADGGRGAAVGANVVTAASSGSRRWPRLSYIIVHGCAGTSQEAIKRQAVLSGMGPGAEVEWMPNTLALTRESWAAVLGGDGGGDGGGRVAGMRVGIEAAQ